MCFFSSGCILENIKFNSFHIYILFNIYEAECRVWINNEKDINVKKLKRYVNYLKKFRPNFIQYKVNYFFLLKIVYDLLFKCTKHIFFRNKKRLILYIIKFHGRFQIKTCWKKSWFKTFLLFKLNGLISSLYTNKKISIIQQTTY